MEIFTTVREMQAHSDRLRLSGKRISLVPTMGALHEGHASLLALARTKSDVVILSVFVNPAQFGPNEDYDRYPRKFDSDVRVARENGADVVFHPDAEEMYQKRFLTYVASHEVADTFEGKIRPTHFRGVTTIVAKLFNITKPHIAVFGEKDAQQLFVLGAMVRDLNFDVELIAAPIIREEDGLARSSRNAYLSAKERTAALSLYRSLMKARGMIEAGERNLERVRSAVLEMIGSSSPSEIDYVAFVDPATFREVGHLGGSPVRVLLAVRFGSTRLIDNMLINTK